MATDTLADVDARVALSLGAPPACPELHDRPQLHPSEEALLRQLLLAHAHAFDIVFGHIGNLLEPHARFY